MSVPLALGAVGALAVGAALTRGSRGRRLGHCYEVAGRYAMKHPKVVLCHGWPGTLASGHAWIEWEETVQDRRPGRQPRAKVRYAMDVERKMTLPVDLFYDLARIDPAEVRCHAHAETAAMCARHRHWGPWPDGVAP